MSGTRGRPPKPDEIKELEGNPGKRPLKKNYPSASGSPSMPKIFDGPTTYGQNLSGYFKAHWKRTVKILEKIGTLYKTDVDALTQYCTAWAMWRVAVDDIAENGQYSISQNAQGAEYMAVNLSVNIANTQWKILSHYENQFGLTPAARSKLTIKKDDPEGEGDFS